MHNQFSKALPVIAIRTLIWLCAIMVSITYSGCKSSRKPSSKQSAEPQPLLSQAIRLQQALEFLGSALSAEDTKRLTALADHKPDSNTVREVQKILDSYCLATVTISPEARVSVVRGAAKAELMQGGWKSFLVKVHNQAGVTAPLEVRSPNAEPLLHGSNNDARPKPSHALTAGQIANRFLELAMYRNRPLQPNLSGLALEYAVVQIYSKDKGQREAEIGFHVGQGTQDIGFRNGVSILFNCKPSVKVIFRVKDDDGTPVMGSFVITDRVERILPDSIRTAPSFDYRLTYAQNEYGVLSKELRGIYPLPSRRLALQDPFPDFYFQPQVYRADGEYVDLAPGEYQVVFTRGPEYLPQTKHLSITDSKDSVEISFRLRRWIDMAKLGWFSADHHVHAAGCSHYESPEEGVDPADMMRQVKGEGLNIAAVLTWGPGWYHQKNFFTGRTSELSTGKNLMRYDVEVSGFPSSHAGHLVLLDMKEDDYPGSRTIEDWPSWTFPVLQWAKKQNTITGYAHSGWGLEPISPTMELPNTVLPKMDGIGANEYVVTVTQNLVDFFSAGDTPAPWELNMWYHTLNCGFRTRLSGETDFPCIFDERVGIARTYFKSAGPVRYDNYIEAIRAGRNYVSDGRSHIIDFTVNGTEMGVGNSELQLQHPEKVLIKAKAVCWLPGTQDEQAADIAKRPLNKSPYWHVERARIGNTRTVPVELIVNGEPVDTVNIIANGSWEDIKFEYNLDRSAWIALRIFPSAHTNPVFALVNGAPVRVKESVAWCLKAIDQCWKMKQPQIRKEEQEMAKQVYENARRIYEGMMK
jgi:hypothetical protein